MLKLWLHEARISNYPLLFGPQLLLLSRILESCWAQRSAHARTDTHDPSGSAGTGPVRSGCPWLDPQFVLIHSRFQGRTSTSKHLRNGGTISGVPLPLMEASWGATSWRWLQGHGGCRGGWGASVSVMGSDSLSGDCAAQATGLWEVLVAETVIQEGRCLYVACFSDTVWHGCN